MVHAPRTFCKWCDEKKIDPKYGQYCSEYCRNMGLKKDKSSD